MGDIKQITIQTWGKWRKKYPIKQYCRIDFKTNRVYPTIINKDGQLLAADVSYKYAQKVLVWPARPEEIIS